MPVVGGDRQGRTLPVWRESQPRRRGHRKRGGSEGVEGHRGKLLTAEYLDKVSSAAGAGAGIDLRVVKVDGNRAYINVGATSGIKVGDTFRVFKRGEELVDPATGAKLGAEEKQTGTGVVTEVNEKFSIMTLTGTAGAGDILKK